MEPTTAVFISHWAQSCASSSAIRQTQNTSTFIVCLNVTAARDRSPPKAGNCVKEPLLRQSARCFLVQDHILQCREPCKLAGRTQWPSRARHSQMSCVVCPCLPFVWSVLKTDRMLALQWCLYRVRHYFRTLSLTPAPNDCS